MPRAKAPPASSTTWRTLVGATAAELRPAHTLLNGQCFGWRPHELREREYVGVLGRRVVAVRQTAAATQYRALHGDGAGLEAELHDYFQLGMALTPLYKVWATASCPRMETITRALPGLRILRQDPAECLISFICSSNNNVPRITLILDRIREKYGEPLCAKAELAGDTPAKPTGRSAAAGGTHAKVETHPGPSPARNKLMPRLEVSDHWYSFPTVERLAEATEDELRRLGLGYRAKFIRNSTLKVIAAAAKGGFADSSAYLHSLRTRPRDEVLSALLELDGVGPKVADCVALFSLDQVDAIPIDTHVWRIACRDYDTTLSQCKSLTPAVYARVGELFRQRFGSHAGWAHQLLFAAELQEFRPLLPRAMLLQMEEAREIEREIKAREKNERDARRAAKDAAAAAGEEEDDADETAMSKRRRLASGTLSKNVVAGAAESGRANKPRKPSKKKPKKQQADGVLNPRVHPDGHKHD
jgi:N-glycosylase/DNA lyase